MPNVPRLRLRLWQEIVLILLTWAVLMWLYPTPPPRCMHEARDATTLECKR